MNQAVFDCKQCGYTQAVDPVHIGTVFSCPTCSAVVMVTAVEPPEAEQVPPHQQTAEAASPAAQQTQQVSPQAQQTEQYATQAQQAATQQAQQAATQQAQQAAQQAYLATQHEQQQAQMHAQEYIQQAAQQETVVAQQTVTQPAATHEQEPTYSTGKHPTQAQAAYAQQPARAAPPQSAVPMQQPGFDPAMVAYQTGAVNSPVGVSVAPYGNITDVSGQPYDSAMDHPLNVPIPDSRRTGSVFGNVLLFAVLYILFMTPYLLPYLKNFGLTDLTLLESGSVMSPFTLKLVCSTCLIIIALFRGIAIGKTWLFVFPVIAGVVAFIPGLGLPSFVSPALHALTLALGVLMSPRRTRKLTF